MRSAVKIIFLAIIFSAWYPELLFGLTVKPLKTIKISQETVLIEKSRDFCVTDDELFVIPDAKAGDIKIFDNKGVLVKILGRKGSGPGEFVTPTACFYKKDENKFGVLDIRLKKIFIYKRTGKTDFQRIQNVYCLRGGTDLQLKEDKLLISGYKRAPNGKAYSLYYINLKNNEPTYLLHSYLKYGLKPSKNFETQFKNNLDLKVIGMLAYFDIHLNDVYFVWQGDLKIFKINIDTGKLGFFGHKTSRYVKPYSSKKMVEAYRVRNTLIRQAEKKKMSFIVNIFASDKYVLLVYEGPVKQEKNSNLWMQVYTFDGKFVEELTIPGQPSRVMYFDKNKSTLYSLTNEIDDEFKEDYSILVYKIIP